MLLVASEKTGFYCICRLIYIFLKFVFQALLNLGFKLAALMMKRFVERAVSNDEQ